MRKAIFRAAAACLLAFTLSGETIPNLPANQAFLFGAAGTGALFSYGPSFSFQTITQSDAGPQYVFVTQSSAGYTLTLGGSEAGGKFRVNGVTYDILFYGPSQPALRLTYLPSRPLLTPLISDQNHYSRATHRDCARLRREGYTGGIATYQCDPFGPMVKLTFDLAGALTATVSPVSSTQGEYLVTGSVDFTTAVPEPASGVLFLLAAGGHTRARWGRSRGDANRLCVTNLHPKHAPASIPSGCQP